MKAQASNCGGRDATWAQRGERRGAPPKLVLGTLNGKRIVMSENDWAVLVFKALEALSAMDIAC